MIVTLLERLFGCGGILAYHGIGYNPISPSMHVDPLQLRTQLEFIASRYNVVPLREFIERTAANRSNSNCVAITFDDAYAGILRYAAPVLRSLDLPATIFVTTTSAASGGAYWWDMVDHLRTSAPEREWAQFVQRLEMPDLPQTDPNAMSAVRHKVLSSYRGRMPSDSIERPMDTGNVWRSLDFSELQQLAADCHFDFGCHTVSHPALPNLTLPKQQYEIEENFNILREQLPRVLRIVAYPYGLYSPSTSDAAHRAGMRAGLTIEGWSVPRQPDMFRVPRIGLAAAHDSRSIAIRLSGVLRPAIALHNRWGQSPLAKYPATLVRKLVRGFAPLRTASGPFAKPVRDGGEDAGRKRRKGIGEPVMTHPPRERFSGRPPESVGTAPETHDAGVSISAAGDLMLGDSAICVGFGLASRYESQGFESIFKYVRPALSGSDISFGNLECTLSTNSISSSRWRAAQMRGRPEFATALRLAGFNVLNVANNHAMQHGDAAFHDTVAILGEVGIQCCGLRGTDPWCSEPVVIPAGTNNVGVLGYCLRPRQYGTRTPPFAQGTPSEILSDVARLKSATTYVLVSLHWGEEFVDHPSTREVEFAHSLVEAGASLILGHHPHVARPVECYGGGVIAYSLGNFIADMLWQPELRRGILLQCRLNGAVKNPAILPTFIDDDYVPRIAGRSAPWAEMTDQLVGLNESNYDRQVDRMLRRQRFATYRYAAVNLRRFDPAVLVELAGTTLRNKVNALARPNG